MAGRALTVDMQDDDLTPAWGTVIELAKSGISAQWTLVGGLMVAAHARRAGVVVRRPTDDVDVFVDFAANRSSLTEARAALAGSASTSARTSSMPTGSDTRTAGRSTSWSRTICRPA